jgi:hypothetical protein
VNDLPDLGVLVFLAGCSLVMLIVLLVAPRSKV